MGENLVKKINDIFKKMKEGISPDIYVHIEPFDFGAIILRWDWKTGGVVGGYVQIINKENEKHINEIIETVKDRINKESDANEVR